MPKLSVIRCKFTLLTTLATLFLAQTSQAVVTFDWAVVGDTSNVADTRIMDKGGAPDNTTGYGAVDYEYSIAKQHVTNSQYVEFLNAADPTGQAPFPNGTYNPNGIYNRNMTVSDIGNPIDSGLGIAYAGGIDYNFGASNGGFYSVKSGQGNFAANWINWNSGARFANWLHNGGLSTSDTENGVYDMSISTTAPPPRQAGATYFIPTEDEFYKAAYYDPTKGGSGGYWEYGIQSDSDPTSEAPTGGATSANFKSSTGNYWQNGSTFDDSLDYRTEVGAYTNATSYYGLHDIDGLLYQWTEDTKTSSFAGELPAYRGGSWFNGPDSTGASHRNLYSFRGSTSYAWFGLRIGSTAPVTAGIDGDYNDDGTVDAADYTIWRDNLGLSDAALNGNGSGDASGLVVSADYSLWSGNYGATSSSSSATSVPEPTAAVLMLVATSIMGLYRRRSA